MRTIVRSASADPISPSTWWQLRLGSIRRKPRLPGGISSAISADAAAPVAAAASRVRGPPRRAARPASAPAPASRPMDHQKLPFAPGSSSALTFRTPWSRIAPTSQSAACLSPSLADSRSKAQSSSSRSRIQEASGRVVGTVEASEAIRENYGS
jgi:hypothetical protein